MNKGRCARSFFVRLVVSILTVIMIAVYAPAGEAVRAYAEYNSKNGEAAEEQVDKDKRELDNPIFTNYDEKVTYDCVWFGSYPQDDVTGRLYEGIKWRVLSVSGDDMLLISDKALDCMPFTQVLYTRVVDDGYEYEDGEEYTFDYDYVGYENVTWSNCTLRTWLNGEFMNSAFSSTEKNAIKSTTVTTRLDKTADGYSNTNTSYTTNDKVYLLSISEYFSAGYGFKSDDYDFGDGTAFAKANGAGNSRSWWLRSPMSRVDADYVAVSGPEEFEPQGHAACTTVGVVPVIHISKSSTVWSYAGTVSSDGTVCEVNTPAAVVKGGWTKTGDTYTFIDASGNTVKKSEGWYLIRDKYYYLDATGKQMTKGADWYVIGDKYYYVNSNGIREARSEGWYLIGGKYFYIQTNGYRVGKSEGWYNISGKYIYIKSTGERVKKTRGWYKINDCYCYLKSSGERVAKERGWYRIGQRMYYLKSNGKRVKKKSGWYNETQYITSSGKTYKGWKKIKGKRYYFNKKGYLKGTGVAYSQKTNKNLYRFKIGKATWYQSVGLGSKKDTSEKLFKKAKKKYPDFYIFDGMGDPTMNQCDIFSYAVATLRGDSYPRSTWKQVKNINRIKAGDIIKYDTGQGGVHFITVTFVFGDFFQYVDANGSGNSLRVWRGHGKKYVKNSVLWDQWGTKTEYKSVFVLYFKRP